MTAIHAMPRSAPGQQLARAPKPAPLPLHLRLRPESGILPRGWLADLRTRYQEGPEGFVAIDRDPPEDLQAPKVLGWGIDRQAARAAATRKSNRDPSTLLVHPCGARITRHYRIASMMRPL